jgi:predicted protein tyrosine phosphatase
VNITNPGAAVSTPSWFKGAHLPLQFGDVVSEADAERWKTRAPNGEDVRQALEFFRDACSAADSRVLISCDYGASRSPALAYVLMADQFGPGREAEAFRLIVEIRPTTVPNGLIVRLGDAHLMRGGALLAPLMEFYETLNAELFPPRP